MEPPPTPLVLFDGPCTLCQRSVRLILRHERAPELYFASLQSETGTHIRKQHNIPPELDSMVFVHEGEAWTGSDAAFKICGYLKPPLRWARVFRYLPAGIHRALYRWVARNRNRWFGRTPDCPLPDPDTKDRFIDL